MLEQNNVNNPSTDDNTNNVTNDGEGETTTDTSKITSTISDYNSEAEEIQSSIENLNVPSNRSDASDLYWEWKSTIEDLENRLDSYENELERMYRNNELSYTDFRTFDGQLQPAASNGA